MINNRDRQYIGAYDHGDYSVGAGEKSCNRMQMMHSILLLSHCRYSGGEKKCPIGVVSSFFRGILIPPAGVIGVLAKLFIFLFS